MQTRYLLVARALLLFVAVLMTACGQLVSSAKREFAEDLSATVLEQDDPETVRQAIPAYLILVSSMIRGDPDNVGLLISGSRLYGAYASVFVEDTTRKHKLSDRSFEFARRAFCLRQPALCNFRELSYYEFEQALTSINVNEVDVLFALGSAWAGWVQAHSSDWNAIAELPRVKAVIQRVLELDDTYSNGDAHLYMAMMYSFLPPAMGGKPELAKEQFERAIAISKQQNLMAMLLYAQKYARLVFDKDLHDRLLRQVIDAKVEVDDMTLINTIAKSRARELLAESDDYF
jgi:tetratricopeptide (TPR) repeat protein